MKTFKHFTESKDLEVLAKKAKIDIKGVDPQQLKWGMEIEKEHDGRRGKDTDVVHRNDAVIMKIAIAHLREKKDYYTKLKKMEGE
jgi:hypothetical protein